VVEQSKFRTRFRVVKTAVAWGELDRLPCAIKLLPNPKKTIGFEQYEGATSSWAHDQGVHILRHTFCSHLAMTAAPARAIQELAGHADLSTTQRYST
jgi:integrase